MIEARHMKLVVCAAGVALALAAEPLMADRLKSPTLGVIADWLWLPGAIACTVLFPEGSHTGGGTWLFVPVAAALNLIFYFVVMLGMLRMMSVVIRPKSRRRST
jgi:amino acid transporter